MLYQKHKTDLGGTRGSLRSSALYLFSLGTTFTAHLYAAAHLVPSGCALSNRPGEQIDSRKCNYGGAKFSKAPRMGNSSNPEDSVSEQQRD